MVIMEFLSAYAIYVYYYIVISFMFLIINAVLAGFSGNTLLKEDYKDSVLWPISLAIILGVFMRIGLTYLRKIKKG